MQNNFTIFLPAGGCGLRDGQEVGITYLRLVIIIMKV
jgi:hypothetical protein